MPKGRKGSAVQLRSKRAAKTIQLSTPSKRRMASLKSLLKQARAIPPIGRKPQQWHVDKAIKHLAAVDKQWEEVFLSEGLPKQIQQRLESGLWDEKSTFHSLLRTIVYQQLAGKAAATIYGRVADALGVSADSIITPEMVLSGKWEEQSIEGKVKVVLNGKRCGLSRQKSKYIRSLAEHFNDKERLKGVDLSELSNEELRTRLTAVKGLGKWSVDMFMMFKLGRPDIMAPGDLAIRKGVAKFKKLPLGSLKKDNKGTQKRVEELTKEWSPYRSIACQYMYHLMDIRDTGE